MARPANRSLDDLRIPDRLDPSAPKGFQIRAILEALAQQLPPGSSLPSERAIAAHFDVARMTVRNEITRLANDGVLTVRPSAGAFVAEPMLSQQQLGRSFSTSAHREGASVGARVLEREVTPVGTRLAEVLGVSGSSSVLRVVRLRTVDGQAVGVERSSLPLERFPGLDEEELDDVSLYGLIEERYGVKRGHVDATAQAILPDQREVDALGCQPGDACLAITSTVRDVEGRVMETGRSTYRGDRYELSASWDMS
ncbi:GntR family transcriptional regulator [Tessaracoccus oleiagri]|uniref:GntR family transcriptional regulator n=1 Tax=Tessaracoccus oleiagri TaxID=686624 RepID=A0A1G9HIR3_9ACTN|nr:GntR family transcriptional regulator [Tessaracoccus oleiagri]SDL12646.1 GntR family transcriptional regulator [Tessaracoccus oleiagri]